MSSFHSQPLSQRQQQQLALNITQVLSTYGFITDSYIIEFFTDNLWEKLPEPWRLALSDLPFLQLSDQLLSNKNTKDISYRSVWPLSLLALTVTARSLTFPRTPRHEASKMNPENLAEFQANHHQSSMLDPLLRKHVKLKKQHEIRQLGKLVKQLSDLTGCDQVVDIGSGQGHLSRFLSFGLGLSVTAVEADRNLVTMATTFDQHLMHMLRKEMGRSAKVSLILQNEVPNIISPKPPQHLSVWVDPKASWEDLVTQLCDSASVEKGEDAHFQAPDFGLSVTEQMCPSQRINTDNAEKSLPPTKGENETTEGLRKRKSGKKRSRLVELKQANPEQSVFRRGTNSHVPHGFSNHCTDEHDTCSSCVIKPFRHCHLSLHSKFVLTGLHACGDLSVAMLRHFARCPSVVGITSVACCYMKITTAEMPQPPGVLSPSHSDETVQQAEYGYPMSSWVAQLPGHKLSYKAREVACHAIEDYTERLKGESSVLRTHCYRAVLETIIRSVDPTMKRAGVQSIKKAHELPFKEYARQGLKRVGLDPNTPLDDVSVEHMLSQHQNVVAFFSLALLLAPLVETLILLDRMIFLQEEGFRCDLIPLFKPRFSPRNLVLVAAKVDPASGDLVGDVKACDVREAGSQHSET
ncbi:hypothetical protein FKM82_016208 [Ascaphus truei]